MRTGIRITLFVAPFLVLPAVGLFYTHLNIGRRMFVDQLGCGCDSGFNTNWLSLTVFGLLVSGAATSWWFAARGLPRIWLWSLFVGFVVLSVAAFQRFCYYNWWL